MEGKEAIFSHTNKTYVNTKSTVALWLHTKRISFDLNCVNNWAKLKVYG